MVRIVLSWRLLALLIAAAMGSGMLAALIEIELGIPKMAFWAYFVRGSLETCVMGIVLLAAPRLDRRHRGDDASP